MARVRIPRILGSTSLAITIAAFCYWVFLKSSITVPQSVHELQTITPTPTPTATPAGIESRSPSKLLNDHETIIYFITPTYSRWSQMPDLIRLSQTLMSVPAIHWILVEDSEIKTTRVSDLIKRMSFPCTHLAERRWKREDALRTTGCTQRNAALTWILKHNITDGVIYFGDDDNTYDLRLFQTIRDTRKVGLVPTGHFPGSGLSTPVVVNGKVTGFHAFWYGRRKWPVDMASISTNIQFWRSRGSPKFYPPKRGHEEDSFLRGLNVSLTDFEAKANNGTQILVWHTRTERIKLNRDQSSLKKYKGTNVSILRKYILDE